MTVQMCAHSWVWFYTVHNSVYKYAYATSAIHVSKLTLGVNEVLAVQI